MTIKNFEKSKAGFVEQGYSDKQADTMAALESGETPSNIDTSNWTEEDWYQNNLRLGMSESDARFAAAVEVGEIDIDDPEVDY